MEYATGNFKQPGPADLAFISPASHEPLPWQILLQQKNRSAKPGIG